MVEYIPEILDMDFLVDNQEDAELAEYLVKNYEKHINDFGQDDMPNACLMMGYIVMRVTEDMEDQKKFEEYNLAALDICQIGLGVSNDIMSEEDENVVLMCYDTVYRLYIESAFVLINLERYDEAESDLDTALDLISNWTEYFEKKNAPYTEAAVDELFFDELTCRSYKAETWWRMSKVADTEEDRIELLKAAKECLVNTVDFFRRLDYEWEENYFGEILEIIEDNLKELDAE